MVININFIILKYIKENFNTREW